jgi:hypothetical protein
MKRYFELMRTDKARKRGFTLLLAALVASIALSLGASIYDIVSKELALSSIGQDSQFAFYAADTAAECALYWDSRFNWFSTTTPTQTASCDGNTIVLLTPPGRANSYTPTSTMEFEINLFTSTINGPSPGYCADVSVEKGVNQSTNAVDTLIIANGYSVSCANIDTASNALQRTVELTY